MRIGKLKLISKDGVRATRRMQKMNGKMRMRRGTTFSKISGLSATVKHLLTFRCNSNMSRL